MTDVKMFARAGGGRLCTAVILDFSPLPFPGWGWVVPGTGTRSLSPRGPSDIAVPTAWP